MHKLYVAMVGLPARGKSTLAKRIRDGLMAEGIQAKLFNNGDMRRALMGAESTSPDFYNPSNAAGREAREMICRRNMDLARGWLADGGEGAAKNFTGHTACARPVHGEKFPHGQDGCHQNQPAQVPAAKVERCGKHRRQNKARDQPCLSL